MKMLFGTSKILAAYIALIIFFSVDVFGQQQATYEVKSGDTLYGISKELGVTIAELQQWNNLESNEIELGQELIYYIQDNQEMESTEELPEASDPLISGDENSQNAFYTVKSGDNLFQIARRHNMSLEQLKALNNLTDDNIRVGQKLAVKKRSVAPSVVRFAEESTPQGIFTVYEIKAGEGLNKILSQFKMTEQELKALNPELDTNSLNRGQEITVLLPPSRKYKNPYLQQANLQDLGEVSVSRYSSSEAGETTTNGELYDPKALTAAHSNIALGSIIFVENTETGNGLYVRINDRITGSGIKLSERAFQVLKLQESRQPAVTIYTENE